MHDPGRGHWEAVKWILWYIKGIIDIGLIFKKDVTGKQECIGYVDSHYMTHEPYCSTVGSLMYAMVCTRPTCHKLSQ